MGEASEEVLTELWRYQECRGAAFAVNTMEAQEAAEKIVRSEATRKVQVEEGKEIWITRQGEAETPGSDFARLTELGLQRVSRLLEAKVRPSQADWSPALQYGFQLRYEEHINMKEARAVLTRVKQRTRDCGRHNK